ncbi:MAG TPA: CDGSH iron-sulfur domain-containing protein [Nitrospiraceae bacterium]|nr:CDGSH iron-sulfur domain-containing protein [Nitrospiraceae bacterium]
MRMSRWRRTIRPGIEPVEFSVNEKNEVALCQCKQTKTPPFCDGTHQTL